MSTTIPEPEQARPWHPERDGPAPEVWMWPNGDRPALEVWAGGKWRMALVLARQNWSDGSVIYQVQVDLLGDSMVTIVAYRWPQPGLRAGHGSGSQPSRAVDKEHQRNTPQQPRRA